MLELEGHERCEQMWIMHILHITSIVKLLNEIIQPDGAKLSPNTNETPW